MHLVATICSSLQFGTVPQSVLVFHDIFVLYLVSPPAWGSLVFPHEKIAGRQFWWECLGRVFYLSLCCVRRHVMSTLILIDVNFGACISYFLSRSR